MTAPAKTDQVAVQMRPHVKLACVKAMAQMPDEMQRGEMVVFLANLLFAYGYDGRTARMVLGHAAACLHQVLADAERAEAGNVH